MNTEYNKDSVVNELETKIVGGNIIFFETIESTNDYVKDFFFELEHGTIIIAREQTKGRGRRGAPWANGRNDSIFMSILLKQNLNMNTVFNLSHICSLSVLNVIKELDNDIDVKIKWPNDIVIGNKKVCGILTEYISVDDGENGLVLGIGINVNNEKFDKEIENRATSLYLNGVNITLQEVVAKVLRDIEKNYYTYLQYGFKFFLKDYRKNCCNIGMEVVVIKDNQKDYGVVIDINVDGSLKFKDKDGKISDIYSNEVSVRGLLGYV